MHELEPFYNWRHLYTAEEDEHSPFFGQEYSEFEYTNTIYNYFIHPQWDEFGSRTLYLKLLFADYDLNYIIIELIGEWNDAVENDIMTLKRAIIDHFIAKGISKFILIMDNVLNFHNSDEEYYEEWLEEINEKGGWIAAINTPVHTASEMRHSKINRYLNFLEIENWRTISPENLFHSIDNKLLFIN